MEYVRFLRIYCSRICAAILRISEYNGMVKAYPDEDALAESGSYYITKGGPDEFPGYAPNADADKSALEAWLSFLTMKYPDIRPLVMNPGELKAKFDSEWSELGSESLIKGIEELISKRMSKLKSDGTIEFEGGSDKAIEKMGLTEKDLESK